MKNTGSTSVIIFAEDYTKYQHLTDCTLCTEDGYEFRIHKYALATRSKYFSMLFTGKNLHLNEFLISGIRGEILFHILCYIYRNDNMYLTPDTAGDTLLAADFLLMKELFLKVKEYAINNITKGNCMQYISISMYTNQEDMFKASFRLLQTNYKDIANSSLSKIGELPVNLLQQLLSDGDLCVENEDVIWDSILKWVTSDITNRQAYVPSLLKCFKLGDVSETLASSVINNDIVTTNPFCETLNEIKAQNVCNTSVQVLSTYFQTEGLSVSTHRLPPKIYFIAHKPAQHSNAEVTDLYITYDENIDLWRKFAEIPSSQLFHAVVEHHIFTSSINGSARTFNMFNVITKVRNTIQTVDMPETEVFVLKHDELIYLFTISLNSNSVRVYNPAFNTWSDVSPMLPTTFISVASLGKKIYVVGLSPGGRKMMAQSFDPELNAWSLLRAPKNYRVDFGLVPYNNRLFLIGGRRQVTLFNYVDVFDPECNTWTRIADLPCKCNYPQGVVLNDQLIVHERGLSYRCTSKPCIRWNDNLQSWHPFEEGSVFHDLVMYRFHAVENVESLKVLTKENRDHNSDFEKTRFA